MYPKTSVPTLTGIYFFAKCIWTVLRAEDSLEGLTLIMDFKPACVACRCSMLAPTLTRVVKITPTQKESKEKNNTAVSVILGVNL